LRQVATQKPAEWTFKADPLYTRILEHVTPAQGRQFLEQVQGEYPGLWPAVAALLPELVSENDRYGKPNTALFPTLGLVCSPSNMRYLSQSLRLLTHADEVGMDRLHIVEIGGGYGGLALYVHRLEGLFPDLAIDAYTIVDLPEAADLQNRMADALDVPYYAVNGLDERQVATALRRTTAPRFLFSAYAFSEFDAETRAWYEHRVARACDHGVVIWNFRNGVKGFGPVLGGPVYQFVDAPLSVMPDRPDMYEEGVLLVRF
jgi:hypothetical protein